MRITVYVLLAFVLTIFSSCKSEKDYLVKIQTRHGDMYAVLFDETPKHKDNFIELAKAGRFDSTDFHRVIQNFMIQGGDVFGKEGLPQDTWPTVTAEIRPGFIHSKGMIAAARMGNNVNPEKRSSGSQFYIVQGKVYTRDELVTDMKLLAENFFKYIQLASNSELKEKYTHLYEEEQFEALNEMMLAEKANMEKFYSISLEKPMTKEQIEAYTTVGGTPHLDGEYTVFGKVVKGLEVMEKIAAEPTGQRDIPENKVYMKISVELLPKSKIEKDFGYSYAK
ncbi:peptidylprolyl isomerase [Cecembia rubra]|uniref:Peptidyl-prolyl cis-trans isomerase n=1 Tax=Cecembia rubra TaxID=1485585 RepID=A0A2P8DNE4_9BACT|nr:peptidylprolyl isomerase [Cecembia rubra]PSK98735.1 peptidyl-prolyl cis-trans isomerase B (cyclophilin B) [Cecembia rubra]